MFESVGAGLYGFQSLPEERWSTESVLGKLAVIADLCCASEEMT